MTNACSAQFMKQKCLARLIAVVLLFLGSFAADRADAQYVTEPGLSLTVNDGLGNTYRVTIEAYAHYNYFYGGAGPTNYLVGDTIPIIEANPWWGSDTFAGNTAIAYKQAVENLGFAFDGTVDRQPFNSSYGNPTSVQIHFSSRRLGPRYGLTTLGENGAYGNKTFLLGNGSGNEWMVLGSAVLIPEIDGNNLMKVLFILAAFGLFLHARRSRNDQGMV